MEVVFYIRRLLSWVCRQFSEKKTGRENSGGCNAYIPIGSMYGIFIYIDLADFYGKCR